MSLIDLKSLNVRELQEFVRSLDWTVYRTQQLLHWIYQKKVTRFSEMTSISKPARELLERKAYLSRLTCIRRQQSLDGTEKLLFRLQDRQEIEAVLIPGNDVGKEQPSNRLTLCISTQVGCTLDCGFCLTGTMGLIRNLSAHEIVEQVLESQRLLSPTESPEPAKVVTGSQGIDPEAKKGDGLDDQAAFRLSKSNRQILSFPGLDSMRLSERRVTNIVLMGMGEPLANYREVMEALERLTHKKMLGFPPRRITLSTSGLVPQIRTLGQSGLPINLAISLNATTDAVRQRVMPAVHRLYPLRKLMAVCRDYPLSPRRHLYFEYVLLSGVNDTEEDARRLVKLLRNIRCKVNLIPFNEYPGASYRRQADHVVLQFQKILMRAGLLAFIRSSRGRDILAACGQLRTESVVDKTSCMV